MADVTVTTEIDAPADAVWALIGDPTRMGDLSPECDRVAWVPPADAPRVGARFRGHNTKGWRKWTTTSTVTAYDDDPARARRVVWHVVYMGQDVADWGYEVAPGTRSTVVTATFTDRRNALAKWGGRIARGVADTEAHNRAGLTETLRRLAEAATSGAHGAEGAQR